MGRYVVWDEVLFNEKPSDDQMWTEIDREPW